MSLLEAGVAMATGHSPTVTAWVKHSRCRAPRRSAHENEGYHTIDKDVFLSLPVVLGENGVTHVIKQTLTEGEIKQLKSSADTLWDVQAGIQF